MRHRGKFSWGAGAAVFLALALLAFLAYGAHTAAAQVPSTFDRVMGKFALLTKEQVEVLGYRVSPVCVDAQDLPPPVLQRLGIPKTSAMGFHAGKEGLFDDRVDPLEPEVLMMLPVDDQLRVVGVEYEASDGGRPAPTVLDQTMNLNPGHPGMEFPHYVLHVWFVDNPAGRFSDWNPALKCPAPVAREATFDDVKARFTGLTKEQVEVLGYRVSPVCVDAQDLPPPVLQRLGIPKTSAMGFHAGKEGLFDDRVDPLEPEVLMMLPVDDQLRVVGVEYEASDGGRPAPTVLGQTMNLTPGHPGMEFPHYVLHVWFVDNPAGRFSDWNPALKCPAAVALPVTGSAGPAQGNAFPWLWLSLAMAGTFLALGGVGLGLRRRGSLRP